MKISIIIPVYKVEKYLNECINSVISQTYQDIEVILVDDGSPDNCPQICDEFMKKDPRIKVIHKKNGGLSDARNQGFLQATGEYVVFLDSDDFWTSNNAIASWIEKINEYSPDILIFESKKYYSQSNSHGKTGEIGISDKKVFEGTEILELMKENVFRICAWDKVVSRDYLIRNNIDFVVNQTSEDMEWCIKLILSKPRIVIDKQVYHAYRQQNTESLTARISSKNVYDVAGTIKKYATESFEANPMQIVVNHFVSNIYVQWLNLTTMISQDSIRELLKEMKSYWYLLKFDNYPLVRKTSKFKFIGFNNLRVLINTYYRIKKRKS